MLDDAYLIAPDVDKVTKLCRPAYLPLCMDYSFKLEV